MAASNLLFFLSIIFSTYLASDALFGESLMSQHLANPGDFPYQVALMGKMNFTDELKLQCGAGIISPNHILAVAQCFIDKYGNQKNLTFSIIVDEISVISRTGGFEVSIDLIYLVEAGSYYLNDISIAKLQRTLNILNNPRLRQLDLPYPLETFERQTGVVAGHGYNNVDTEFEYDEVLPTKTVRGVNAGTDGKLRYGYVDISYTKSCTYGSPHETVNMFCGKMHYWSNRSVDWGICELDTGSPLVFTLHNRKVVGGLASTSDVECNDKPFGGLYTSVERYLAFINGVLSRKLERGTIVYNNLAHERNRPPVLAS